MRLLETGLAGLMRVVPDKRRDERGFFARVWDEAAFAAAGVAFRPTVMSVSFNAARHTLRGMHWQAAPFGETKLVRASRGRAFDVAVDLRPGSATRLSWFAAVLEAGSHEGLLIPPGFAHGFLTLEEGTEITYLIEGEYAPEASRGARWDDPALGIAWPGEPAVIGERDLEWGAIA